MKRVYNNEFSHSDIDVYECGTEECKANHSYGPGVKEFYKIHYIHKGKGSFEVDGKTYNLEKGQGFVIFPNTLVYYKADSEEPWEYSWVAFQGIKAESLLRQAALLNGVPVFNSPNEELINYCLKEMLNSDRLIHGRSSYLKGYLYIIFAQHIENSRLFSNFKDISDPKEDYVRKAVEFIEKNYDKKITVDTVAKYLSINSKYLWKLFQRYLNISPVKYIVNIKIEKACQLMNNSSLSISDISRSVGYEDALQFSKMFKSIKGISPSFYRKNNIN